MLLKENIGGIAKMYVGHMIFSFFFFEIQECCKQTNRFFHVLPFEN